MQIIDAVRIVNALENSGNPPLAQVQDILQKASEKRGLTLDESACLLNVQEKELTAVRLLVQMRKWLGEVNPDEPFYIKHEIPQNAKGSGLTEAARGALGHWINIEDGKIKNYQVITLTAWNVSPMDANDKHGAIEQALIGTPVEDDSNPVEVAHVIRSYDPCLVCTIHAYRGSKHLKTLHFDHWHEHD